MQLHGSVAKKKQLEILAELFETDIVQIKELFFGDKFAKEAYENGCSDKTFVVAEKAVQYFRTINAKQGKLSL